MNAVIYARYSSDSQREESIEGQLRECREYAIECTTVGMKFASAPRVPGICQYQPEDNFRPIVSSASAGNMPSAKI